MKKILEVKNATKKFGGLIANTDISFDVEEGSIVGIVGPNGAGKTTLFNSLSGAYRLTSGQIIFNDVDTTSKKAHEICQLGMGRTFQIPQTLNDMQVLENIIVGSLCRHSSVKEATAHALEISEICGLTKYNREQAGKLNVIQKKRLEIARALASQPKLLLLDETMAGLTGGERIEAVDLIRAINASGVTILMIEHVMEVVMSVSSKVVVLVSGKLLIEGTPEEVTSNEEVISAYLGGTR